MITLMRAYLPDGSATLGVWDNGHGFRCCTLELPWRMNKQNVSCIPEGEYQLRLRESSVIKRTTNGDFLHGYEILDVPGRKWIMVHPGNWTHNTDGCVLTGERFWWHHDYGPMVTSSQSTFRRFMAAHKPLPAADLLLTVKTCKGPFKIPEDAR